MKIGLTQLLLLSFSLCLSTLAQPFDYSNLPFLGAGSVSNINSLIPTNGLYVYYIDTNLAQGPVSDWVDVVRTNHATQVIGAKQPLMTSTGLTFTGSQALVFSNLTAIPLKSFMFAIYNTPDGGGTGLFDDNNGNFSFTTAIGGARSLWRTFQNGTGTFTITGFIPTNILQIICSGLTNNSFFGNYTNGILDPTIATENIIPGITNLGFSGAFVLREFGVWTNVFLDPTIASNLNLYKTFKYP